jgi:hypothetical protein
MAAHERQPPRREPKLGEELEEKDAPDRPPGDLERRGSDWADLDGELEADEEREDDPQPGHERIGPLRRPGEPVVELALAAPSRRQDAGSLGRHAHELPRIGRPDARSAPNAQRAATSR